MDVSDALIDYLSDIMSPLQEMNSLSKEKWPVMAVSFFVVNFTVW